MAVILWQGLVHTSGPGLLAHNGVIADATRDIGAKISGDRETVEVVIVALDTDPADALAQVQEVLVLNGDHQVGTRALDIGQRQKGSDMTILPGDRQTMVTELDRIKGLHQWSELSGQTRVGGKQDVLMLLGMIRALAEEADQARQETQAVQRDLADLRLTARHEPSTVHGEWRDPPSYPPGFDARSGVPSND